MEKTIILPNWLTEHGLYFLCAIIFLMTLIFWSAFKNKIWWSLGGLAMIMILILTVPDAHEFRASNLKGILA